MNIIRETQTHRYKEQTSGHRRRRGEQARGNTGIGGEGTELLGVRQTTRGAPHKDYSRCFMVTGNGKELLDIIWSKHAQEHFKK